MLSYSAILLAEGCAYLSLPEVEEVIEVVADTAIEAGAAMVGQDVDATIDISPCLNPRCKNCSFHCPSGF